jgi:hypothetical protein
MKFCLLGNKQLHTGESPTFEMNVLLPFADRSVSEEDGGDIMPRNIPPL